MQSLFGENKILYDPEKQAEWNKGKKSKKEKKKRKRKQKEKKPRGKKINDPSLLNHIFLLLLQKYKTVLEDVIMPKNMGRMGGRTIYTLLHALF